MKVLVIGATGPTGRELVKQGLALGHRITAAVRRPESAALPADTQIVRGDVTDRISLRAAVAGQDAILCSLGSKLSRQPTTLLSAGTRNLLAAMEENGVRRILCITGLGAGDSRGHGGFFYDRIFQPLLLKEIYLDKDRQEAILRASASDWTLVRPGVLTNGPMTGKYRALTDMAGEKLGRISRADVAGFLLRSLAEPETIRQIYNLTY